MLNRPIDYPLLPIFLLLIASCVYFFRPTDDLMQNVFSRQPFEKICNHKFYIWMASFLHELMQHVDSMYSCGNNSGHKCYILWFISFMNHCNMLVQVTISRRSVSNVILKWFFMLIQITLLRTVVFKMTSFPHELLQHVDSSNL